MDKQVDNFLEHWGILGMKWGIRRKVNPSTGRVGSGSADYVKAKSLKRKRLKDMSNDEIQTLTRRMQLESEYSRLTTPTKSRGRRFLEGALKSVGNQAAKEFNKQFIEPRVQKTMTKALASLAKKTARRSAG